MQDSLGVLVPTSAIQLPMLVIGAVAFGFGPWQPVECLRREDESGGEKLAWPLVPLPVPRLGATNHFMAGNRRLAQHGHGSAFAAGTLFRLPRLPISAF